MKTDKNLTENKNNLKNQEHTTDVDNKKSTKIDPMGTEVMQEDNYHNNKHGDVIKKNNKKCDN